MLINLPLYNYIFDLNDRNYLRVYGIQKKQSGTRNYCLISLKQNKPVLPSPYDSYRLSDTHFSVDEYYLSDFKNVKDGWTPIHYTQKYTLDDIEISVRVFLDEEGEYVYHKIPDEIKLTNDQKLVLEQKLKDNLKDASPVLKTLIKNHKKKKTELKNQADRLDLELSKLSRSLSPKNIREEYIHKAGEFIKLIEQFNRYSVAQDARANIMKNMIKNLQAIYSSASPLESKSENNNTSGISDIDTENSSTIAEPKEPQISPREKIKKLYQSTLEELDKQVVSFKESHQESEKIQLAKNIQNQLFLIDNFESEISRKDSEKIACIDNMISVFKVAQLDKLKTIALAGDITGFKEIYSSCSDSIPMDFYAILINDLVENPWNQIQEKKLEILDFLNDVDPNYKRYIAQASKENKYKLPLKVYPLLLNNYKIATNKSQLETVSISLLLKIYFEEKLSLFNKLVTHGANPKTWGSQSKSQTYPVATLFYTIILFNTENYLEYLKVLIQHGADPNIIYTQESITHDNQSKINFKTPKEKNHKIKKIPFFYFDKNDFDYPISFLHIQSGIEGLKMILPKVSLSQLTTHLMSFINAPRLKTLIGATSSYAIMYGNSRDILYSHFKTLAVPKMGYYLSYGIYPDPNLSKEVFEKAKTINTEIHMLIAAIVEKLKVFTLEKFDTEYESLFKEAVIKRNATEDESYNLKQSFFMFLACECLLMSYSKINYPDPKKQSLFVQKYTSILYSNIILTLNKIPDRQDRIKIYQTAKNSFEVDFQSILYDPAPVILSSGLAPSSSATGSKPKTGAAKPSTAEPSLERKGPPV